MCLLPKEIEILPQEGFLEVRFLGTFSVVQFNRQVDSAIRACEERSDRLLLVDYTRVSGVPTVLERFEISTYGARIAARMAKIAGLGTPGQVGDRFGTLVARNRGLDVEVFTDRGAAIRWLLGSA